ncbi:uncharacterized protein [Montipora capricornis]|uniref:uncharacterized protein n=1 Tax=Montipora capricornis TaxID=246305 RepID=UPI0035F18355
MSNGAKWLLTTREESSKHVKENQLNMVQEINTIPNYVAPTELELLTSHDAPSFSKTLVFIALSRIRRTAPGPDNIPFWAWKKFSLELASAITHIYNTSLAIQKIPARWKSANIGPIPKETNTTSLDQLRPISVTDMIMRLLER